MSDEPSKASLEGRASERRDGGAHQRRKRKEKGHQDLTPHSSVVARTVEGSLEGIKEKKRACVWALKHTKKRGGGGAPAKGSLALKEAGAHVFIWFGRQGMLGQIQEGPEV